MPILRMSQIREMRPRERIKKLEELRVELSQQRVIIAGGGSMENPGKSREIRRAIARILTVMHEEERKSAKSASSE
ncbi:MAG: 50S ribosomal protein L29 [Promethearchaeota archaeon]